MKNCLLFGFVDVAEAVIWSFPVEIARVCVGGVLIVDDGEPAEAAASDGVDLKGGSRYTRGAGASRKWMMYKSLAGLHLPTTRR